MLIYKNKQMRNTYKILLFLAILIGSFVSCKNDKFFELQRPPEFPWSNVKDFEMAASSAYNTALLNEWGSAFGNGLAMDFTLSDLGGYIKGTVEGWPAAEINSRLFSTTRFNWEYGPCYTGISSINSALEWYESKNENPFPEASAFDKEKNLKRVVGELHFIRAYLYYYLVRSSHPAYDPTGTNSDKFLPYILKSPTTQGEALQPEFGTTQQFYDLIVGDLKKAIEMVPAKYEVGMHPAFQHGRANKYAIKGLLSRVYMQMGKYNDAEVQLNDIVNSGEFALEPNILDNFTRDLDSYTKPNKEILWEAFYADASNNRAGFSSLRMSQFTRCFPWNDGGGGKGEHFNWCYWHQYFVSVYACQRIGWWDKDSLLTNVANRDKRSHEIFYNFLGRYRAPAGNAPDSIYDPHGKVNYNTMYVDKYYREKNPPHANMPLIRYAEILLNRSILRFRAGNKQGAAEDLNIVRKRSFDAKVAGVTYESSSDFLTTSNITEEIIHCERIKELTGEVEWIPYLQALRLPITKGDRTPDMNIQSGMETVNAPYTGFFSKLDPLELQFFRKTE